jgi:hypothetical protein
MSVRALSALLLFLIACSDPVLAPNGECTAPVCATAKQLCTTAACAAAPCTPDCRFRNAHDGACPSDLAVAVPTAQVTACPGLCGFAVPSGSSASGPTSPGTCYHYQADAPGCADRDPSCTGYNAACWFNDVGFRQDEAAICHAGGSCYDGSYVIEDLAGGNTCNDFSTKD